jgi:trehalose 6-phosphate synthase/phosphatase
MSSTWGHDPAEAAMNRDRSTTGRLILVSNRLPFSVKETDGRLEYLPSAGGLVTGLASFLAAMGETPGVPQEYLWVGWPGAAVSAPLIPSVEEYALRVHRSIPVHITVEEMDAFYLGFCNRTIWPLFHYFPSLTEYREHFWETYNRVNDLTCEAVLRTAREGDLVWIHDYHLMLLPGMLRDRMPGLRIGFFLHIPFPSFEVFRLLPGTWRRGLLTGLLGADLIGFHTFDYTQHFLQSVLRILGFEDQFGVLALPQHIVKAGTFPMGIDFDHYEQAAGGPEAVREMERLRGSLRGKRAILSVDRLDYTKGILNRLQAFEDLLSAVPEYRGALVLLMVVVPSRVMVDRYDDMKRQIEESVGRINGKFGTVEWTPVVYQYRYLPLHPLAALYALSDVALVTPLRDGMNLVAKEYVAARRNEDGVLILSEMVGAAKELGEAIIVNPNNRMELAQALREALEMPLREQSRRMRVMRQRLRRYTVGRWAGDFLAQLAGTAAAEASYLAKLLPAPTRARLLRQYSQARNRLLLLDYDGTLVPLARTPDLAAPTEEVLRLLTQLAAQDDTTLVVISGRDRKTLESWLGRLPVHLVAEHGMWLRSPGSDWRLLKPQSAEWKARLMPILELYADRLPGAIIEEKDFSLAWHYRAADPEQSQALVGDLRDHLMSVTANIDLQVLQGSKVVEVRGSGINKGIAALEWLGTGQYDFLFAAGDDWTDEDLFGVLPETAWSVKVGVASTRARYNVRDHRDLVRILEGMAERETGPGSAPVPPDEVAAGSA